MNGTIRRAAHRTVTASRCQALLIGYLAMTQMGALGFGKTSTPQEQTQQNAIEQAQNAVDAINNRLQQTDLEP